jgi:hypothetical protein
MHQYMLESYRVLTGESRSASFVVIFVMWSVVAGEGRRIWKLGWRYCLMRKGALMIENLRIGEVVWNHD